MHFLSKVIMTSACLLMVALAWGSSPSGLTIASSHASTVIDASSSPSKVLIHITTTSDWTHLRLVSGGTWANPTQVSSSPEASTATIEGNLVSLSQPLARAQAGQKVEMTFDVVFSDLIPNNQVVFEIQRGFIGYTQVELSAYAGGQPVLLKTFTWDQTNKDNGNIVEVQILADDILTPLVATPKPNAYIVVAQLNLWYFGTGCYGGFEAYDCSGKCTTPFTPALGETYSSSDPHGRIN